MERTGKWKEKENRKNKENGNNRKMLNRGVYKQAKAIRESLRKSTNVNEPVPMLMAQKVLWKCCWKPVVNLMMLAQTRIA
jgi:hypothetical protein